MKLKIIFISIFVFLGGCSGSDNIAGLYICDGLRNPQIELKEGGIGYIKNTAGVSMVKFEYKKEGENLHIDDEGSSNVLVIKGGSIIGEPFGTCTKS